MDEKKKETYIHLKLGGYIDDKQKLAEKYNIDIASIKTIAKTVQEREEITAEEYEKLQDEFNTKIQNIKNICTDERKEGFGSIYKFYNWYIKYDDIGTCCYCGVHKDDLNDDIFKRSKRNRGQSLEVERVVTFPAEKNKYTEDNCRLACYICNNAKSDFLNPSDFRPIAEGINKFWKTRLKKDVVFPKDSDIWNME